MKPKDIVNKLRTSVRNGLRRPTGYLRSEWNRLAPRERRLVSVLGGAVAAFAVLVGAFLIFDSLGALRESNNDAREALAAIAKHRDEYLEAKSRMVAQEVRIGTEPPQLEADLEAAAREVGIQIPVTTPRAPAPAGKRYLEHNADITLRQVDLLSLSKFLQKLETGRRLIVVTRMHVRRRFSEGDKMDVELTATAYERVKDDRAAKKRAGLKPTGAKP